MKYMLLIHQGTTPTPRDPEAWERLSAEEQQGLHYGELMLEGGKLLTSGPSGYARTE